MFSKTKLQAFLIENKYIDNPKHLGYEAFGKKVYAFIHVANIETRRKLEDHLTTLKQKIDRNYWPGAPYVSVRVTYFKAWHWDE
jgi:hypothetical protein